MEISNENSTHTETEFRFILVNLNRIDLQNIIKENTHSIDQSNSAFHYYDLFLNDLTKLYNKPVANRTLYKPITQLMISHDFFQVMSQILKKINQQRLLSETSALRDIFNMICHIVMSYADDDLAFRRNATKSELIETLVKIVADPFNEKSPNSLCIECVNNAIKSLYNVTRLESKLTRYKELRIAPILLSKIPGLTCQRARVCAVLCLGWTLHLDEIERIKNQTNLVEQLSFEEGVCFAFGLLEKAFQTGIYLST